MPTIEAKTIQVPKSYMTPCDSDLLITNHPVSAPGVTAILIVTLNRPKKYNAMTVPMIEGLLKVLQQIDVDSRVKCVVLTGAGKAFCSGIDLNLDATAGKQMPVADLRDIGGRLALAMYNCRKTIIVAYNGLSVGIGMTSTLAAGIRIASSKSVFGFPFSRIGLTMESASSFFLPRMVGHSNATYLLTTGKTYHADSKVLDGIFAEVLAEPEDVLPRALELACEITKEVSLMAAYLNRQLIWRGAGTAEEAHLVDSPILFDMFGGRDHLESKRAFFKKEKPKFIDEVENDAPRAYPWWTEVNVDLKPKGARQADSKL